MTDLLAEGWPGDLRLATDRDATAVRQLIGGCFVEYEGCVLDPEGIDAWMAAPASAYADKGGQFWVLAEPDTPALMACVGWGPDRPGRIELKNLYVASTARRRGLGRRLVALVESAAHDHGAGEVILWSDTRFLDAHRLYAASGYRRTQAQRALHDPSNSIEYEFVKRL